MIILLTTSETAVSSGKTLKSEKINYTGLASHPQTDIIARQQKGHTGLLSLELDTENINDAVKFVNSLKLFIKGCSWGGHESLAMIPMMHEPQEILDECLVKT